MFQWKLFRRYTAPLVILLAFATSCSSTGDGKEEKASIPPWSISFRWSADSGIDLQSPDMQIVRATIESNTIAEFLDRDYGYPGWRYVDDGGNYDAVRDHPMRAGVGTAYLHLKLDHDSRWIVCKDMSETATKVDGKYPYPDPANRKQNLEAIAIGLAGEVDSTAKNSQPAKVPSGPIIPGPPDRSARPNHDVFSRFALVHYQYEYDNYRKPCVDWAESRWGGPQPPKPTRTENEPPKIEPFSPGWAE